MGFPRFEDINDSSTYDWQTLNLQPTPIVAGARDFTITQKEMRDDTQKLCGVWKQTERRIWDVEWFITRAELETLRGWWRRGGFWLYPDNENLSVRYKVVWDGDEFLPIFEKGGNYTVNATLIQTEAF